MSDLTKNPTEGTRSDTRVLDDSFWKLVIPASADVDAVCARIAADARQSYGPTFDDAMAWRQACEDVVSVATIAEQFDVSVEELRRLTSSPA